MSTMQVLLSRARCSGCRPFSSPYLVLNRGLCSSGHDSKPDPSADASPILNPNPPQNDYRRLSVPIHPVPYPAKPREKTPASTEETPFPPHQQPQGDSRPRQSLGVPDSVNHETRRSWTREDTRYVKDAPSISPVSYPARVAPLPEDRVAAESIEDGEKAANENMEEMEKERWRIEAENRARRTAFRRASVEEDSVAVPFPTLIMPEKKREKRPVLDLMDAIKEVKANAKANFDETMEAHVRLGIERGRSELIVRGTLALRHSMKKDVRVAFFAEGADAEDARAAGADIVGGVELIEEIASSGKIDFDRCFATPQVMPRVYKISRILNHHGLMPNPKQGGVTKDVAKAIREAKAGHTKFRMDKTSIVHVPLGKVSFSDEALRENVGAFMHALLQAKPAGLKKTSKYAGYVNGFHICSTMGPGFPISIQSLSRAADHYTRLQLKDV